MATVVNRCVCSLETEESVSSYIEESGSDTEVIEKSLWFFAYRLPGEEDSRVIHLYAADRREARRMVRTFKREQSVRVREVYLGRGPACGIDEIIVLRWLPSVHVRADGSIIEGCCMRPCLCGRGATNMSCPAAHMRYK